MKKIQTVGDIPSDYILVQNDFEIQLLAEEFGRDLPGVQYVFLPPYLYMTFEEMDRTTLWYAYGLGLEQPVYRIRRKK